MEINSNEILWIGVKFQIELTNAHTLQKRNETTPDS